MADAPFRSGSIITLHTFDHDQHLPVEILSSVSIDSGSSARIFKGQLNLLRHSSLVALKVFPSVLGEDREEVLYDTGHRSRETVAGLTGNRQMLRRELQAASSLRHRWILPFLGTATHDFRMIIVAPYMKNGNMLSYFRQNRRAPRQRLIVQVAEAVYFLHARAGLVHGDLKCENVLVSDEGNAQLADFGLSTVVEKEESNTTTATGIRQQSTLRFAAPELLLGSDFEIEPGTGNSVRPRSKTTQSDVYAFGMLVLQAFTGDKPWSHLRLEAIMLNVCMGVRHPRPGIAATDLGLTDAWWSVCLDCWHSVPERRPGMLHVWDTLASNVQVHVAHRALRGHSSHVTCVAYTPDGRGVLSCSWDQAIRIWDVETGQTTIGPLIGHDDYVRAVAVSPDGQRFASAGDDCTVVFWDTASGSALGPPTRGHLASITSLSFLPDGLFMVSGSDDHSIRLWDMSTLKPYGERMVGHTDWVGSVAFSPDGRTILSASGDRTVRLWDSRTCSVQEDGVLTGHERVVRAARFSPSGALVASASYDHTVRLWDVRTRRAVHTMRGHTYPATSVAFSPSGKYVASSGDDATIRLWDAASGEMVGAPICGHSGYVRCIAFSPDGASLASGSADSSVCIWDLLDSLEL